MTALSFRRAKLDDLEFVTNALIEAEKSGSRFTTYERLFDLSPGDLRSLLGAILREDVLGSEFCCRSFLLAICDREPVASIATWIEAGGGPSSVIVRATLLSFVLGSERWNAAQDRIRALAGVNVPRQLGALQIEAVYTAPGHRGRGIAAALISYALAECKAATPAVTHSQIVSVIENESSARVFRRVGYVEVDRKSSSDPAVRALFPGSGRILWQKGL